MPKMGAAPVKQKVVRGEDSKLNVIAPSRAWMQRLTVRLKITVVGAGLGGLGCAVACLLAGHDVEVLESAAEIGEVRSRLSICATLGTCF